MKYPVIFLCVLSFICTRAQIDQVYKKKLGIEEHNKESNKSILFMNVIGLNLTGVGDRTSFYDAGIGLNYSPNLAFKMGDQASFALGSNVNLAIGDGFILAAPLHVGLNLGCGSTKFTDARIGAFCNVGMNYVNSSYSDLSFVGAVLDVGIRFNIWDPRGHYAAHSELRLTFCNGFGNTHQYGSFSYGIVFGRYRL